MVVRALEVLSQMGWILDDDRSVSFIFDLWIADVPLICWPTFTTIDTFDSISIFDLLLMDGT